MLAAGQRLRRREGFTTTIRAGRRAGRGSLVVHLTLAAPQTRHETRAGFVVARTVGNAVTRNLVRRRLRHLVRDRLTQLPAGDVVVRALPESAHRSYAQLGADLDAAIAAARRSTKRSKEQS